MSKAVNLKKLSKHWNKVVDEVFKICTEHLDCSECPFRTVAEGYTICNVARLDIAINRLDNSPKYAQVELPELIVNEERGEK